MKKEIITRGGYKSLNKQFTDRIIHCPVCKVENKLYEFDELPADVRKHFEKIRKVHPAMCPVVGLCPVCRKWSTLSIGMNEDRKRKRKSK
ncbi:hypothetical protein ES705_33878 [subsurface metagenome]